MEPAALSEAGLTDLVEAFATNVLYIEAALAAEGNTACEVTS